MDVGGCQGRRLVLALEVHQGDVVADDILLGVNAVVEVADGAGQTAGGGVVAVDDLVGGSDDVVGCGEVEGTGGAPALLVSRTLLVPADDVGDILNDLDRGGGNGGSQDHGNKSELHFVDI